MTATVTNPTRSRTRSDNADSGDTVDIDPGTYAEQLTIGKSLTIEQTPNSTGTVIIQTPAP